MTAPSEVRQYTLALPAGTKTSRPILLDMRMPARVVNTIQVVVPPGCNGVVGFRILNSGLPIIPYDSDGWVITSGETIQWPVDGAITSGAWGAEGFNLGINQHAVYIRMLVRPPGQLVTPTGVALVPLSALSGPTDQEVT